MTALMDLIDDCMEAKTDGATPDRLAQALDHQRKATFLFDFVEAENSTGFHAPQESARILMKSLDHARRGQRVLKTGPVE